METYTKISQYFWLFVGVVSLVIVTYGGITEGFNRWAMFYVFPGLAFMAFIVKWFLINRLKKQSNLEAHNKLKAEAKKKRS